jgi:hypothetical protein
MLCDLISSVEKGNSGVNDGKHSDCKQVKVSVPTSVSASYFFT